MIDCLALVNVRIRHSIMQQKPSFSFPVSRQVIGLVASVFCLLFCNVLWAASVPSAPKIAASAHILIDAATDEVLSEENVDEPLAPASLTKMMTSYVAASEIEAGRFSMDDMVDISVKAWRTPGSKMFIREGTKVRLSELLKGLVIQSGNDASVAIAEYIAGSESAFADMMNQHAQRLGMSASHFTNCTGLPSEDHYTTARDLSILSQALIRDYPEHYKTYSERSFKYNDIDQPNRNRLLWRDRTVDGIKTGFTNAAGYCLVASAKRDDMRLISVVLGTDSDEARMRESQKLLSYGFRYYQTQKLYDEGVPLKTTELWYGQTDELNLGLEKAITLTIPRGRYEDLKAETDLTKTIKAPIVKGDELGEIRISLDGDIVYRAPLVALSDVEEAGFFKNVRHGVYLLFNDLMN